MFQTVYEKTYSSYTEETLRKKILLNNIHKIVKHNMKYDLGMSSYRMGLNKYADMVSRHFHANMLFVQELSEISPCMNGLEMPMNITKGSLYQTTRGIELPDSVDWRQKGYVTQVKYQASCGSCWAYSATGTLEGQHYRITGKLVSLSEQNLVDCSNPEGNKGCSGGLPIYAYNYVIKNGGIDTEDSYPYEAEEGECRYSAENIGATCTGYMNIPSKNEEALKEAVATIGPISVGINAQASFVAYSEGIYNEPYCSSTALNHGVLVVGYGSENGIDYWIVKNSWSTLWGEKGYIKMIRNKKNQCGIATAATYPLM
ncbi:hypothetical protein LAZ67_3003141 [Cordylochernes scorpioides]|uniref:Cathepsin L n=1 Tax=Cordylochernes scorpioides TaxID=51811 RepID=A0ABY6KBP0_9ARAC|nr:hypothetical protein LAZ67_3003141 [Cordylochernes scorpioides]